jgi:hypothetical protein
MQMRSTILRALAVAAALPLAQLPASAQPYRGWSCNDLWHARNEIYARNGYCFRTQRAINAFGRGCFPPYGRLTGADSREVARIQATERRRRCPA